MESFLRCRDLPGYCRAGTDDPTMIRVVKATRESSSPAYPLILNTFDDLDGPILARIRQRLPKTYTIGPAHEHLQSRLGMSGWNSTLESIVAGVPMICWPFFADQQVNSRFVSEVLKLGLDMKDVCDRRVVARMVNELMVERKEEFRRKAVEMARMAKESVEEGGSSYRNLELLIEDIKLMSSSQVQGLGEIGN
ncbi:unnamed protein product [Linum tenue]|uniref:Uncharacterized protein n=1 Tax=Linum tenue TaxID=586396 RepID=A0AAV0MCD1_9ROSI|nr:unnamed protein product [Linum tenue]